MHPTIAMYMAQSRQDDLKAEAARERLAREARQTAPPATPKRPPGIIATARHQIAALLPTT